MDAGLDETGLRIAVYLTTAYSADARSTRESPSPGGALP